MKPVSTARSALHTEFVYFLDDRVEVGRMNMTLFEEMRRMSYRDVIALTTWRRPRMALLVSGGCSALGGLMVMAVMTGAGAGEVGAWLGGSLLALGLMLLFRGRAGSATWFRLEGPHAALDGMLAGGHAKQERLVAELAERIRAAQR